jgi:hypothetical protein
VRQQVPITIVSWKLVEKRVKEDIWRRFKDVFNIPNDRGKKKTFKICGDHFRQFKARLSKRYIHRETDEDPCNMYDIRCEEWEEFKAQAQSEDFQV